MRILFVNGSLNQNGNTAALTEAQIDIVLRLEIPDNVFFEILNNLNWVISYGKG